MNEGDEDRTLVVVKVGDVGWRGEVEVCMENGDVAFGQKWMDRNGSGG